MKFIEDVFLHINRTSQGHQALLLASYLYVAVACHFNVHLFDLLQLKKFPLQVRSIWLTYKTVFAVIKILCIQIINVVPYIKYFFEIL